MQQHTISTITPQWQVVAIVAGMFGLCRQKGRESPSFVDLQMSLTNQQAELDERHLGGVGPEMANYRAMRRRRWFHVKHPPARVTSQFLIITHSRVDMQTHEP